MTDEIIQKSFADILTQPDRILNSEETSSVEYKEKEAIIVFLFISVSGRYLPLCVVMNSMVTWHIRDRMDESSYILRLYRKGFKQMG